MATECFTNTLRWFNDSKFSLNVCVFAPDFLSGTVQLLVVTCFCPLCSTT